MYRKINYRFAGKRPQAIRAYDAAVIDRPLGVTRFVPAEIIVNFIIRYATESS